MCRYPRLLHGPAVKSELRFGSDTPGVAKPQSPLQCSHGSVHTGFDPSGNLELFEDELRCGRVGYSFHLDLSSPDAC